MNGPIVVAFDGTPAAEHALSWAAETALRRGSRLVVVATTWWPVTLEPVPPAPCLVPPGCLDLAVAAATASRPGITVSSVESGSVGELLAHAAGLDASLIVLAAENRVPWRTLVRGADRPLVFAGASAGPVVAEVRNQRIRTDALALAFELARAAGTSLKILHTAAAWHLPRATELAGCVVAELAGWMASNPDVAITYRFTGAPRVRTLALCSRTASVLLPGR
ncbi:universal stress protein [Amycolatopsis echigonensis]|uniref:Universal stress protein n=1 Tax=Amycolatopsis echigonensis TaxID=2576905 RepID=A0A8E2BAA5_9PSEU|nr:universal stress protein [Amycolatopsis echigonensis]MBB2506282.1 universal stress protein [Amycolatopsis echigonensis]